MKLDEFKIIIETYGGDIHRWPETKRIEAEKLLQTSNEAKYALLEAMELDALLSQYDVSEAEDRLARKIVYENTEPKGKGVFYYLFSPFLNPSLAVALLVLFLVFGFMVGFLNGFTSIQQSPADSATLLLGPIEAGVI